MNWLEVYAEELRKDCLYNSSFRICAISAYKNDKLSVFLTKNSAHIWQYPPRPYLSLLNNYSLPFFLYTLDICSWKVKRFVLLNILPLAEDFWSERLTYPFYEQLKRRESSKESTWRIQCFSIPTWSIKSFANRAKFYGYLVILYLDNKL